VKIAALREAFERVSADLPPDDVSALVQALKRLDDMSLSEFTKALSKIKAPKATVPPPNPEAAIARYLSELRSARMDTATFDGILERMKADRTFKVPEANRLAQAFLANDDEYKTKPQALKAMAKRRFASERNQARKSKVGGIF